MYLFSLALRNISISLYIIAHLTCFLHKKTLNLHKKDVVFVKENEISDDIRFFAKIISIFVHHKDSFSKSNLFLNILLSIGDEVIVTSTDYDMEQTERRSLVDCPECSANQIKVDRKYDIM